MNANAQDFVIADFEDKAIGDTYTVFHRWNGENKGTATVAADPSGKENKVVNLITNDYDCVFQTDVTLPEGKTLGDYLALSFDIYSTGDIWKCMFIYVDGQEVFRNQKEENGEIKDDYPFQATGGVWTTKSYSFEIGRAHV